MDIQRKAFESSNNVNPDWSFKFDEELQQYIALDSEMELQVDEFNEHWDTFRAGWQAAKAQAVPEGFVLVKMDDLELLRDSALEIKYASLNNDSDRIFSDIEDIQLSIERLIEAQEPDHD